MTSPAGDRHRPISATVAPVGSEGLVLVVLVLPLPGFLLTALVGRRLGRLAWAFAVAGHRRHLGRGHGGGLPGR